MKKRIYLLVAAVLMSAAVTACGQKAEETTGEETQISMETQNDAQTPAETTDNVAEETQAAEGTVSEVTEETKAEESQAPAETEAPAEEAPVEEVPADGTYEDNFAVDAAAASEFAQKIKAAVAEKNVETMADLASYPLYMGFADGSVSVTSRDEFIALGADRIFTAEMTAAMEGADDSNLSPSRAGFSLTKDGKPNVVFGVVEGKLAVVGMNY